MFAFYLSKDEAAGIYALKSSGSVFNPNDYYTKAGAEQMFYNKVETGLLIDERITNNNGNYWDTTQISNVLAFYPSKIDADGKYALKDDVWTMDQVYSKQAAWDVFYRKAETDSAIAAALTNYWTSAQVGDMFAFYAPRLEVYSKTDIENGFYNKVASDTRFALKNSGVTFDANNYYTKAEMITTLGGYYTSVVTDGFFLTKSQAATNYYLKADTDSRISTAL